MMKMNWDLETELVDLVTALGSRNLDFAATYMNVSNLQYIIGTSPDILTAETVSVLGNVLEQKRHSSQKQAFFLYRKVANAVASILIATSEKTLADLALTTLSCIVATSDGTAHRAAAEALGSIPLHISGSLPEPELVETQIPYIRWDKLLKQEKSSGRSFPVWIGRTLVISAGYQNVLAVKLARSDDSIDSLRNEAIWMDLLFSQAADFPVRFDIPRPVTIKGSFLIRLKDLPLDLPAGESIHPSRYAIGFMVHRDYFLYPNEQVKNRQLSETVFKEVIFRNAWLLGKLTSEGIVHTAPIPLFHNRSQRRRREDSGIYEWTKGGRLDRWLSSCQYPNIGMSGLRDFEHFIPFEDSPRKLYEYIGTHILSLVLISGSYFRNKDVGRRGLDPQGNPVDVRNLFDREALKELVRGIFMNYFNGFTGDIFEAELPVDVSGLVDRMIEKMGVDNDMEEFLRVADQVGMSEKAYNRFLMQNGYSRDESIFMKKGEKDIPIYTGPHLGGFNNSISLPELLHYVATASSFCVSGRYLKEMNSC